MDNICDSIYNAVRTHLVFSVLLSSEKISLPATLTLAPYWRLYTRLPVSSWDSCRSNQRTEHAARVCGGFGAPIHCHSYRLLETQTQIVSGMLPFSSDICRYLGGGDDTRGAISAWQ